MTEQQQLTISFNGDEWKDVIAEGAALTGFSGDVAGWARRALLTSALQARGIRHAQPTDDLKDWWALTTPTSETVFDRHQSMMRVAHDLGGDTDLIFREIAVLLASLRHRADPKMLNTAQDANGAGEWHLALKLVVSSVSRQKIKLSVTEFMGITWLLNELKMTAPGDLIIATGAVEMNYTAPDEEQDG